VSAPPRTEEQERLFTLCKSNCFYFGLSVEIAQPQEQKERRILLFHEFLGQSSTVSAFVATCAP
jgi:hypothetical protein